VPSLRDVLHRFQRIKREDSSDRRHHDKWIVLSVHHAAECVCNMRLVGLDPAQFLNERPWFPSLTKAIKQLQAPTNEERLGPAERQLFLLFSKVTNSRHQFMHQAGPENLDLSIAAMCMIGILKYIERATGETGSDIVWQSRPIESDVVASIRNTRLEESNKFVALFLREKYPNERLPQCPSCAVEAIISSTCQACFEEFDQVRCSGCDAEIYFTAWERKHGDRAVECHDCGLKQAL
jgi:hypothetical protein